MDPYYIFPRELWEKIFDLVENPLDKLNLIRAYPNLQAQCVETEKELLFLSALPMILDNLESCERSQYYSDRKEERSAFLSCRLVSSSSCKVVDKWMESYWKKSTGDHKHPSFLEVDQIGDSPAFIYPERRFDDFLRDFPNHLKTRMPLLSRFVIIRIPHENHRLHYVEDKDIEVMEAEYSKMATIFQKIGRHLRKLKVHFHTDCFSHPEVKLSSLKSLQKVLKLSPNLRSLSLEFLKEYRYAVNQEEFQFPQLPQLNHLKLHWRSRVNRNHFVTFVSIREYFPQLVELEIWDILHFQDDYLKNAELFPNLKTLKLGRDTFYEYSTNSWEGKLRKICREIRAPNLINIEFTFEDRWSVFETIQDWEEFKPRVEMLTRHSLFCLNKLNNFYSNPEQGNQWTGYCGTTVNNWDSSESIIIKLSRKLD